jgi:Fur family transcriptional regulator, ferric uptake regulator
MMKNDKIYREFLLKHNLKSTKQRRLIFESFLKLKGHITSEAFCTVIKKIDISIGQATVYRMLKLLSDSGIARKLEMGNGVPVYELGVGKKHHDHLICEKCYKTVEFHDETLEKLQLKLAESHNFTLTGHKMFLYGICSQCQVLGDL